VVAIVLRQYSDPVNDLAFIGMIQNLGGNRPGRITVRADSAKLVYAAPGP